MEISVWLLAIITSSFTFLTAMASGLAQVATSLRKYNTTWKQLPRIFRMTQAWQQFVS